MGGLAALAAPHRRIGSPRGNRQRRLRRGRDLNRLTVGAPTPGRLTLGYVGHRLVAAEPQTSLAVVGPTGCGKTAGFAIPALLEWTGPVIATSVKNDLLGPTFERRRKLGQVWIYDPTGKSGQRSSRWSPLASCGTWPGAMRIAAWLCEAAQPRIDTVTDGDYWYTQARKALAPYLHAAAIDGRHMADVVRWIDGQEVDEVEAILRHIGGMATKSNAFVRPTRRRPVAASCDPRSRRYSSLPSAKASLRFPPDAARVAGSDSRSVRGPSPSTISLPR